MIDWLKVRYFKANEFDSPDEPGSGERINPELIRILELMRAEIGKPLVINSGVRSVAHNAKVAGVDSSSHVNGDAVDIRAYSSQTRYQIIRLALSYGITRIGVGKTFVHIDISKDHPPDVVWTYAGR